ncbi:di-heme oxidoredictase family protein [Myxococcus sp. SDU36]|uniref:di-heme oxidoreductase family protein n=1 Tax=Myxococcus sp. SDU36 TaxID=2831967 RepID=UPI002542D6C6|nr:di-heme oxidoredictase family protein [Myxococcus sp. SDU36]WIG98844.1 thiol oxidoreductase [Myxococcus sp. SDU36]
MPPLHRIVTAGLALCNLGCGPEPAALEPGEHLPGGATTVELLLGSNAFTFPAANMTSERKAAFFSGNSFFNQAWVTAPASTTARDGLGPTFNANSCSACHFKDGRGEPGADPEAPSVSLLLRIGLGADPVDGVVPDPVYGDQLQPRATGKVPAEGRMRIEWEEVGGRYADGEPYTLVVPRPAVVDLAFGPLSPDAQLSARVAPQMIGLGLLEAIPESRLRELADPEDRDGDGISGRVQWVWDVGAGTHRAGRFGWKAEQPSVRQQTAGALLGDLGVTSSLFPRQNCPPAQEACLAAIGGGEPEAEDGTLDRMTFYSQTLGVPARRGADDPRVLEGKTLFREAGCDRCHVPSHQTETLPGVDEVEHQRIWPYTDLMLHDMGPGLADGRAIFGASGQEWRTPPLWGLGLVPTVNGHARLLHDGRARGFAEAILWHGGEAEAAREAFRHLSRADRARLLAFLESL